MKKLFLLFLITYSISFAQNRIIGQLIDTATDVGIVKANVLLTRLSDSVKYLYISDKKGYFMFENIKRGNYEISISHIAFKKIQFPVSVNYKSTELGKIYLTSKTYKANDVVVTGKIVPVVQKHDTVEYTAAAYKVNQDATAEDLVSKIPGVIIQDGKVQAQGEDIKKVVIDGKQFFGDDPNAVLKNIPADLIDKVQVFDEMSEQAKFSGFDDGKSSKTLNIVTKNRNKDKSFGKATAGTGNEKTYKANSILNYFKGDEKISFLTQFNNINEQNFSRDDDNSGGGSMMGGFGGGRGGHGGGGLSVSGGSAYGRTTTKAIGAQFADVWNNSIDFSGSYVFSYLDNNSLLNTNRKYFVDPIAGQVYNEYSNSDKTTTSHKLSFKTNIDLDDNNSFDIEPKLSIIKRESNSLSQASYFDKNNKLTNFINNLTNSNTTNLSSSTDLVYRHRFETQGRTISIGASGSFTQNDGSSNLDNDKTLYNNTIIFDTTNQYNDNFKKGFSLSTNLVYTEPLSEHNLLQFSYSLSYGYDKSDMKNYDLQNSNNIANDIFDTTLSNIYQRYNRVNSAGLGYKYQNENLNITAGFNYNKTDLHGDQDYPLESITNRTFNSYLPSLMLRYSVGKSENLRINYRASNTIPSISQLQEVLDNSNPLLLNIGNASLTQDNRHSLMLRYSKSFESNMTSILFMLNGTVAQNYIGNSTFIAANDTTIRNIHLGKGVQLSTYDNLDGYYNLRSFIAYSVPITLISSNLNFNVSMSYSRTPALFNSILNYAKTTNLSLGTVLSSGISESIDFSIFSNSAFINTKNTLKNAQNEDYFTQTTKLKLYWDIYYDIIFQTDLSHQYNSGQTNNSLSTVVLNLNLGKKLFDKKFELRFSALNVLGEDKYIQHNITDSYTEDVRSNYLGRYYMVSLIYKLSAF